MPVYTELFKHFRHSFLTNTSLWNAVDLYPLSFSETTICQAFARKCPTMFCNSSYVPELTFAWWCKLQVQRFLCHCQELSFHQICCSFPLTFAQAFDSDPLPPSYFSECCGGYHSSRPDYLISELCPILEQFLSLPFSHWLFSFVSFGRNKKLRYSITHHALDYLNIFPFLPLPGLFRLNCLIPCVAPKQIWSLNNLNKSHPLLWHLGVLQDV